MDGNAIVDLHLTLTDEVVSRVEEKKKQKKYEIFSQIVRGQITTQ